MERVNKWMKKLFYVTNFKNVERQAMIHVERLITFSSVLQLPRWDYGRHPTPVVQGIKAPKARIKTVPLKESVATVVQEILGESLPIQSKCFRKQKKKKKKKKSLIRCFSFSVHAQEGLHRWIPH